MKPTTADNYELILSTLNSESDRIEALALKEYEKVIIKPGADKRDLLKELDATIKKLSEIRWAIENETGSIETRETMKLKFEN